MSNIKSFFAVFYPFLNQVSNLRDNRILQQYRTCQSTDSYSSQAIAIIGERFDLTENNNELPG
jgi:hypothetical protein